MTLRTIGCVLIGLGLAFVAGSCGDAATPASPSSPTSPVTARFDGQFAIGGAASRTFTAADAGPVTVTLTAVGPPADVVVGLGIGIPRADNGGCSLNHAVQTAGATGPQLTATVEAGNYCARVYDVGNLSTQVAFSMTIVHP